MRLKNSALRLLLSASALLLLAGCFAHKKADAAPEDQKPASYKTPWGELGRAEAIPGSGLWIPALAAGAKEKNALSDFLAATDKVVDLFYGEGSYAELKDEMKDWDGKSPRMSGLVEGDFDLTYSQAVGEPVVSFRIESEYMGAYPNDTTSGLTIDLKTGQKVAAADFIAGDRMDDLLANLNAQYQSRVAKWIKDNKDMPADIKDELIKQKIERDELDRFYALGTESGGLPTLYFFHNDGLPHAVEVFSVDPWYPIPPRSLAGYLIKENRRSVFLCSPK